MPRRSRSTAAPTGPVLVDSSGWIAFFSRRDANHGPASDLLRTAAALRVPLLTTNLVVAETQRLLLFRAGTGAAARALDAIDGSPLVTIHFAGEDDHRAAREWLRRRSDQPVTYTDAVSFVVMEAARCRGFVGFDGDFVAAGFTPWQP